MARKCGKKWKTICKGCNLECTVPPHFKTNVYRDDPYIMDFRFKCERIKAIEREAYLEKNIKTKTIKLDDETWRTFSEKLNII